MRLTETFSVDSLPVATGNYDPVPAGWYPVTINSAEIKDTKSGTGQYINIRYDITGENHAGRVVFGMINIRNANPKAEEIGRQQLGELLRAIGLSMVTDTDELIGAQLSIKVAISEREGYDPRNEVKGFKALAGIVPKPSAPPAAKSTTVAPPWAK
jgi:hypothetical protein